jgi:hypothetical protein
MIDSGFMPAKIPRDVYADIFIWMNLIAIPSNKKPPNFR